MESLVAQRIKSVLESKQISIAAFFKNDRNAAGKLQSPTSW